MPFSALPQMLQQPGGKAALIQHLKQLERRSQCATVMFDQHVPDIVPAMNGNINPDQCYNKVSGPPFVKHTDTYRMMIVRMIMVMIIIIIIMRMTMLAGIGELYAPMT